MNFEAILPYHYALVPTKVVTGWTL